jgi:hypothetical protein
MVHPPVIPANPGKSGHRILKNNEYCASGQNRVLAGRPRTSLDSTGRNLHFLVIVINYT